jgi:hypothetical protein
MDGWMDGTKFERNDKLREEDKLKVFLLSLHIRSKYITQVLLWWDKLVNDRVINTKIIYCLDIILEKGRKRNNMR